MSSAIQSFSSRSALNVLSKTANYAVAVSDDIIICSGTFAVSLLAIAAALAKPLTIINVGTGIITITPSSGETIGSEASIELQAGTSPLHPSLTIVPVGGTTKWYVQ